MAVALMGRILMVSILVDMERKFSITVVSAGQTPLTTNVTNQHTGAQVLTTTAKDIFWKKAYAIW